MALPISGAACMRSITIRGHIPCPATAFETHCDAAVLAFNLRLQKRVYAALAGSSRRDGQATSRRDRAREHSSTR